MKKKEELIFCPLGGSGEIGMNMNLYAYGTEENQKISLSKKQVKNLIDQENFLSNIINISLDGKSISVLPREVSYDTLSDEPIHIDFLRIVKGAKII